MLVRFVAGLALSQIGLYRWREWSRIEKSYFVQTFVIASVGGILVGNFLFIFGPLHFYHFSQTSSALPMFAGIFAIGLFFAVLFQRSGNLWMVAIFHGIGNSYIDGTQRH